MSQEAFASQEHPDFIFSVRREEDGIRVLSPNVTLSSDGDPLGFLVTLQKAPTPIEFGTEINNITIDNESPKLQSMFEEARNLRDIPERERPRRLLELLRTNVHYAYNDAVEELSKTDPELAKWISENTGISSPGHIPISLSEMVDSGFGICRHLSVAMLALAKEAGMEGAYMTYSSPMSSSPEPNPRFVIKNVARKDTGEPLFKSTPVGEVVWGGHAWVELKTSEGEWIPVDPSTKLVGDNPDELQTFKDANYIAYPTPSFDIKGLPPYVLASNLGELWFLPGEDEHTGKININSIPKRKPIRIGASNAQTSEDDGEIWPKPTSYEGPLDILATSTPSSLSMNVSVKEFKPL